MPQSPETCDHKSQQDSLTEYSHGAGVVLEHAGGPGFHTQHYQKTPRANKKRKNFKSILYYNNHKDII